MTVPLDQAMLLLENGGTALCCDEVCEIVLREVPDTDNVFLIIEFGNTALIKFTTTENQDVEIVGGSMFLYERGTRYTTGSQIQITPLYPDDLGDRLRSILENL